MCTHICICNSRKRDHEFKGGKERGWAHGRVGRKERKGRNGVIIFLKILKHFMELILARETSYRRHFKPKECSTPGVIGQRCIFLMLTDIVLCEEKESK